MTILYEFRITMPLTLEEYQIGHLYSVAQTSLSVSNQGNNSANGNNHHQGVTILENRPFNNHPLRPGQLDSGQYTHKLYDVTSKIPGYIQAMAPKGTLLIHEEAWNAFPYTKTILTDPEADKYLKEGFLLQFETEHVAHDRGNLENVHCLSEEQLQMRKVVHIDIANDCRSNKDFDINLDPRKFAPAKAEDRGPLKGSDWRQHCQPVMTAYKLMTLKFKWIMLNKVIQDLIVSSERKLITTFHRNMFCWMDSWYGLTMADIRSLEEKTKKDLNAMPAAADARKGAGQEQRGCKATSIEEEGKSLSESNHLSQNAINQTI